VKNKNASKRSVNFASRLEQRECTLPWTKGIFFGTSASGQRAVIIGPGGVCSKDANGCSGRGIGEPIIAAKAVGGRLGTGSVGTPAGSIGQPIAARSGVANSPGAIESGGVRGKRCQLTPNSRARASAYRLAKEILRVGRAVGLVAMSFSHFPMNIRASIFAAWNAVWLYVACWTARRVIGRDAGGCVVTA
jgi:hypothetical protein